MVYGPAGYPKGLLDPDFFAREAKQLKLPPELSERFKNYSHDLAEQFHLAVDNAVKECRQQAVQASPNQMSQHLRHANQELETKLNALIDQAHSDLLDLAGAQHAESVDLFVQDLHKVLSSHTDIEGKLRQESTMKSKLPPKSVFELTAESPKKEKIGTERTKVQATPQAGGQDPLDSYYQKILAWQQQVSGGNTQSGQYQFGADVLDIIKSLENQLPPGTIDDVIKQINQQLIDSQNSGEPQWDVYIRYFGLTPDMLNSVSSLLSGGSTPLEIPPMTDIDNIYISEINWAQKTIKDPNAPERFLINDFGHELDKLGSAGSLDDLRKWAQSEMSSGNFTQSLYSHELQFCKLVGVDPPSPSLQKYYDDVTTWQKQFSPDSGAYKLATAILKAILKLKGIGSQDPLGDILKQISQDVFQNGNLPGCDVYILFSASQGQDSGLGLTQEQLNDLSNNILIDSKQQLQVPSMTPMDQKYKDALNWIKNNPGPLANDLYKEMQKLGSSGNVDALAAWAQDEAATTNYDQASPATQASFCQFCGISPALPPHWLQDIENWQKQFPVDKYGGGYALAQRIIDYINGLHGPKPQSLSDLLNYIYNQVYTSSSYPNCDVYVFFTSDISPNNSLTQSDLESLANILQDPAAKPPLKLTVPKYTQMDQIMRDTFWKSKNYPKDTPLFADLYNQILQLGSSDNNLDTLRKWALAELQSANFGNASPGAQQTFCDILGIQMPAFSQYLNGITQWEQQFDKNSPQYSLGEKIKNIILSLEGKTNKLSDVLAEIYKSVYEDPKNPGQDVYMLFAVNQQQLSDLGKILTQNGTTLQIPNFTQMDHTYLDSYNWLLGLTSNPDKALAQKLLKEIQALGSNGQLSALTTWAQGLIDNKDPAYTAASPDAQAQFQIITGASDSTGLSTFEKEIAQYLSKREGDLTQWFQWLSGYGVQQPQNDAQWRRFGEQTTVLDDDIQYAITHPDEWQNLATKYHLNPNGDIQKEAEDLLNGRKQALGAHESINLFTQVLSEIKSLEASKGTLGDLKKWAETINLNTKDYSYLTSDDIQLFDKMLAYTGK